MSEAKTWPVGSFPPPARGQVRRDIISGDLVYVMVKPAEGGAWRVRWTDEVRTFSLPASVIAADPLAEPWTDTDSETAALRAEVARLTADVAVAEQRGRERERADWLAWLGGMTVSLEDDPREALEEIVNDGARGAHVGASEVGRG